MSVKGTSEPLRVNAFAQLSASLAHAPLRSKAAAEPAVATVTTSRSAARATLAEKNSSCFPSMPAQHQRLDRQQQRLDAQQECMHKRGCIDHVQGNALQRAGLRVRDHVVIAGVGVDDATRARCHAFEAALVERLEKDEDRAGLPQALRIEQLLASP